jgi:hypothetical protein
MAEPVADKPPRTPAARGRRAAAIAYWAVVAAIAVVVAVEISWQVLGAPGPPAPYPTCHAGLRALQGAVVRARDAAAHSTEGENAALGRFRDALQPEWTYRDGVAGRCRGTPKDEGALDAIERLRYAEEHAVRREAGELAPLRRRVQAIVDGDLTEESRENPAQKPGAPPLPPASPPPGRSPAPPQ